MAPVVTQSDAVTPYRKKVFNYLALGDSYTIGQSIPEDENHPNQLVTLLKKDGLEGQLKIIAVTGWTTGQLKTAVSLAQNDGSLRESYDIVTLLIGVNDQYRGLDAAAYKPTFEALLKKAIGLAGDNANHVIVLSIPDWGVTPFAGGKESSRIAGEIDAYNHINKQLSKQYGTNYVEITWDTRVTGNDRGFLAADGLHYSEKEYALWAEKLAEKIKLLLR